MSAMVTQVRIETTLDERRALAAFLGKPGNQPATRKEIKEYVHGCIAAALDAPTPAPAPEPIRASANTLLEMAVKEREIEPRLKGKSDGFCIGWCKVKYASQLRR